MIVSASLVHAKGSQRSFQPSMKAVIASISSRTELNVPRRMACRVMIPKKISTRFNHDPEVGVPRQPGVHGRMLVGGVVVAHQVQPLPRVSLGDLLEERQELLVAVPGQAGLLDPSGGHLERGEQRGGAVRM